MAIEKFDVQEFAQNFTGEELETIRNFLGRLESLWSPDVRALLLQISNGLVPLIGTSASKIYFDATKNLDIAHDKKDLVYKTLQVVSASNLLHELFKYTQHIKQDVVVSDNTSYNEPEIFRVERSEPKASISGITNARKRETPKTMKYYEIDDEEYTVKSRYAHPSPTGVVEGYPPLLKRKKKSPVDYQ